MGRLLIALPPSILMAVGLFSFMAWMVDKGHQNAPEPSDVVRFDMVMVENTADVQRRQRSVPEPPETPEPMDLSEAVAQVDTQIEPMSPMTPVNTLDLSTALNGIAINAPNLNSMMSNQQALPLYRVEPRYPSSALKSRTEGYVVMRFTIDTTGRPKDIEVIEAKPRRMFERESIRALRQWKYQPKVENGVSIEQLGQTARVEFNLAK